MHQEESGHRPIDLSAYVRANAGSAALGAACLIFFGYFWGLLRPTGSDTFAIGNLIFYYTLRIGGPLLGIVALLSWAGVVLSLVMDAAVSVIVGLALAASGVLMLAGGGWGPQSILTLVFAFFFVRAGWHNGRGYLSLSRRTASRPDGFSSPGQEFPSQPSARLAERLRDARKSRSAPLSDARSVSHLSSAANDPVLCSDDASSPPVNDVEDSTRPSPSATESPQGYLASFAPRYEAEHHPPSSQKD